MAMFLVGCPKRASKAVPTGRKSGYNTAKVDEGGDGACTASNGLFKRLSKHTNSYTKMSEALGAIGKIPSKYGFESDIPGFRQVSGSVLPDLKAEYDNAVYTLKVAIGKFLWDLPSLKTRIIESYDGFDSHVVDEVIEELNKVNPSEQTLMKGVPPLKVIQPADIGMVPQDTVDELLIRSSMESSVAMMEKIDSGVVTLLESLSSIQRVKGQAEDLEKSIEGLGLLIQEFSSSPDLVDRWTKALKALKAIPKPEKGDSSSFPEIQLKASEALELFKPSEDTGGYATTPDAPTVKPLTTVEDEDFL
jgi:hypothetical protein